MNNQIVFESNRLVIGWADPQDNEYEYWGHLKLSDKEAGVLSEAGTELFEVHDDGTESVIDDVDHAIKRNVRICLEIGDMSEIGIPSLKPDTNKLVIEWSLEDIKSRDETLSDDQARGVLELLSKHDHENIGVNWEVIDTLISIYQQREDDERIADIITRCDGIEIQAVHIDAHSGDTVPADSDNAITHYGVYGHLKEGGVDWLRDFKIYESKIYSPKISQNNAKGFAIRFAYKFNLPVSEC